VQFQLLLGEGKPQAVFQRPALAHLLVERDMVVAERAPAAGLGRIERKIGIAHQLGGIIAIAWRNRDPHAGAQVDRLPVELERVRRHGFDHACGERRGRIGSTAGRVQDGELVAAQPGDDIVPTQGGAQAVCHHAKDDVAGSMAQRVVHRLEAIQIQHQHRVRGARVAVRGRVQGEEIEEAGAVGQPRQGIGKRQQAHLRFGLEALALVPHCDHGLDLVP
jgi:hypothetical protein